MLGLFLYYNIKFINYLPIRMYAPTNVDTKPKSTITVTTIAKWPTSDGAAVGAGLSPLLPVSQSR